MFLTQSNLKNNITCKTENLASVKKEAFILIMRILKLKLQALLITV